MNILVALLKFPPDFTGAGQRIENMYVRLLARRSIDRVLVLTTSQRDMQTSDAKRRVIDVFFVGKNAYINHQSSFEGRIMKFFYVLTSAAVVIKRYLKSYRKFDLVHTVDSSWVSTLVGWLAFFTKKPLIKEIVLIGTDDPETLKKKKGILTRHFFLFPFHYAKLVITISEPLKNICLRSGLPAEKIWSRHNPVYAETVSERELESFSWENVSFEKKNILFVGSLIRRKNIEFLLKAGEYLRGDVNLLFAGPAEDERYFKYLFILAQELKEKTNGRILPSFLGWVKDRKKLGLLYMKSDLSWFASLNEGMGNVVIESLLFGTPVITLPVCGIMRHIIKAPEEGQIVFENDPQVFARVANHYLYERPNDRQSLAQKSKERFNPEQIEEQYLAQFKELSCKSFP